MKIYCFKVLIKVKALSLTGALRKLSKRLVDRKQIRYGEPIPGNAYKYDRAVWKGKETLREYGRFIRAHGSKENKTVN